MNKFFDLISTLKECLKNLDWQSILMHSANAVIENNKNRINEGLVYGSPELDQFLLKAGSVALVQNAVQVPTSFDGGLAVHIATELHSVGGHSAALKDVIRALPNRRHVILITNLFERLNEHEVFLNLADILSPSVAFKLAPVGLGDKLLWAQRELSLMRPSMLTLFNNHSDSVAIACAIPQLAEKTFYFHHCDHNFALGLFIKHAFHVDCHAIVHRTCRYFLGVTNQVYWPLVATDHGKRIGHTFMKDEQIKTCSHGGMHKFIAPEHYTYFDLIILRLKTAPGTHEHIGKLTPEVIEFFKASLTNHSIPLERLVLCENVSSLWRHFRESDIDLCISSFPEQGGKGNVEVMGAGIPILIHESSISPLRSSPNTVYQNAMIWRDLDEFVHVLKSLNSSLLYDHSVIARQHYENWHHPLELQYAVNNARYTAPLPPITNQFTDTYALSSR